MGFQLHKFNPNVLEYKRKHGHAPVILVLGKRGSGKCSAKGTLAVMYDGLLKKVEDIKVGDLLMGDDSKPRRVLNLSTGRSPMYKIKQNQGDDYIVNENHVLSLAVAAVNSVGRPINLQGKKCYRGDIIDIPIKDYLKLSKTTREEKLKGYKVAVEFPEKEVPIDPYLLGLWLGDGTSLSPIITNQDSAIIKYLKENLNKYDCYLQYDLNRREYNHYDYKINPINNDNKFWKSIISFNLKNNKHIPQLFKCNSRENRLKLLAGLIDTDGHYDGHGCYDIMQKNYILTKDIEYLVRSLGFTGDIKECKKSCQTGAIGTYYRLCISGEGIDEIPCLIPRKKAKPYAHNKNSLYTGIKVEELGIDDYYGFEVDGNHRYLLGDFTVTHNSTLVADILYHLTDIPMFMCMSGTEDGNGFYGKHIHDLFIYTSFNKDIIEKVVKQQKDMVKELRNNGKDPKLYSNRGVGILMDDLQKDKSIMTDPNVQEIFYNGRHFHITTILSLQFMMALPPGFRANVDYVFVCKETKKDNIARLYKYFFGMFENEKMFKQALLKCTDDYGCLVLDTTSRSNRIEDQVFYYKAIPDRQFKIGEKNWNRWDTFLKNDEEEEEEEQNTMNFG